MGLPAPRRGGASPVYQGDDDVLHVHVLVQLCAGPQEGVQSLQVELIREHLQITAESADARRNPCPWVLDSLTGLEVHVWGGNHFNLIGLS